MLATSLVLVAALLHATWNTLIKFSGERLLVIASMDTVALAFAVLALPFVQLPPASIWPWLLASALAEQLYRYLLIQAYRVGDLGLVYPLMRGLSPLVVLG
ncbi:transporter, partial [Pseudomonas sp. TJI-51]